jgi:tRNA pseudouridine38-40 synthase
MPRFRLTLAYDGRPFTGWQSQPSGQTVQDTLEAAIRKILPDHPLRVLASGRTDAGVHALGQVVHFDIPGEKTLPPEAWLRALNVHLPPSVRVLVSDQVPDTFHARFDAVGKTYRYRIWTGPILPPLEAGLAHHHPRPLDAALLAQACQALAGTHDFTNFAAFRGNEDGTEDNTRTLWSVVPEQTGDLLTLTFHGSGFLYKMVRLLTGAILRVAVGRESLTWLTDLLHRHVPDKCAHVAPAAGLYLVAVHYPDAS